MSNNPFNQPSVLQQIADTKGSYKVFPQIYEHTNQWLTGTSICEFGGRFVVAQRLLNMKSGSVTENWRKNISTIVISELEFDELVLVPRKIIAWDRSDENVSLEDPRLFVYKGQLQLWAVAGRFYPLPTSIRQVILTLDSNFEVINQIYPPYGRNSDLGYEKNWCPIIGTTMFVYKTDKEHIVIDFESSIVHKSRGLSWPYGEFHGGTQVVAIEDRYLMILHSRLDIPENIAVHSGLSALQYFVGAYTFENSPPYRILEYTKEPLFSGSFKDVVVSGSPASIFVSGAMIPDGGENLYLTLHINDCQSVLAQIPVNYILKRLDRF